MIHVSFVDEPASFHANVRVPGNAALAAGTDPLPPHWTKCIDDLHEAYGRVCAYVCIRIPRVVGAHSVDHLIPKSKDRSLAYEWSNYRLACSLMNSRKGATDDVLDPFDVQDGWFELDLVYGQLRPSPAVTDAQREAIDRTIARLKLNDAECRGARLEILDDYLDEQFTFEFLERLSPLIAREARRAGLEPRPRGG